MNQNPYAPPGVEQANLPAPGPTPPTGVRRWWLLWVGAYLFPFGWLFLLAFLEESGLLVIGSDQMLGLLLFFGPFGLSLLGVLVALRLAPYRWGKRMLLLLATLMAYPIGFFFTMFAIIFCFGFAAT